MINRCQANKCAKVIKPGLLMCPPHWRMVPKPLQSRIYSLYKPFPTNEERRHYIEAVRNAKEVVEYLESKNAS